MRPYEKLYFANRVRNLFQNERTNVSRKDASIIGLPQDGGGGGGVWGGGNPGELDFVESYVGWDFDIHNDPWGGKFDSTVILKSWEDLGMSDEWCAVLENTQNSFEQVSPRLGPRMAEGKVWRSIVLFF